ncbi:hypothetical protein [Halorhabdus tiamatea]|uniref:hypothetical protein n=1 Tax=Halorhabdus tiamatea TaxID=430914 RepID=UPI0011D1A9E4|nr:hypothetical protein [Halorhabdus tiamatea]
MRKYENSAITKNSRRRFIKGIGALSIGGLGIAQTDKVAAKNGVKKFVGHTYDPVTHEIFGPATAKLNRTPVGVRGILKTQDRKIQLKLNNPNISSAPKEMVEHSPHNQPLTFKTVHKYKNKPDITVSLSSANGITGYYSLSTEKTQTAFKLSKVERHGSVTATDKAATNGIQMKKNQTNIP